MSCRILTLTVFSALAFSAGACNSALDPSTAPFAAGQGTGSPVADDKGGQRPAGVSDDSLLQLPGGPYYPVTHDIGDDRGVDDPATHDVNDDRGVDNPATHDVGDDHGGDRGDNGSGRGGAE